MIQKSFRYHLKHFPDIFNSPFDLLIVLLFYSYFYSEWFFIQNLHNTLGLSLLSFEQVRVFNLSQIFLNQSTALPSAKYDLKKYQLAFSIKKI